VDVPPVHAPPVDSPFEVVPDEAEPPAGDALPFDPYEIDAAEDRSPAARRARRKAGAASRVVRKLSRQQRIRRQRIRSTIVMLVCAAVLFATVVLLSRR
jgi:hypothetical protein